MFFKDTFFSNEIKKKKAKEVLTSLKVQTTTIIESKSVVGVISSPDRTMNLHDYFLTSLQFRVRRLRDGLFPLIDNRTKTKQAKTRDEKQCE